MNNDITETRYPSAVSVPDGKTILVLFVTLVAGLWLDWAVPFWGQIAAALMAWGLFLVLYRRMEKPAQVLLMCCLVLATLGEIFCSLIWQLYDYRFYNIALYVPPGHVLVFLLGIYLAPKMPKYISWLVPALTAPYVLAGLLFGFDEFGIVLYLMYIGCVLAAKNRRFYATMFLLCLLLELYGTYMGDWTWRPEVRFWGLRTTNPPVVAGAFYCVLDFLTFLAARAYAAIGRLHIPKMNTVRHRLEDYCRPGRAYLPKLELVPIKKDDVVE